MNQLHDRRWRALLAAGGWVGFSCSSNLFRINFFCVFEKVVLDRTYTERDSWASARGLVP